MRRYTAPVALMILSACGGGDDITDPGTTFTLTVSGSGDGHVRTMPGVRPALDCHLSGTGQPTGVCSAAYPEGTVVPFTASPGPSSSFDRWSGDAAGCSTALFCSIVMTQNKTAGAAIVPGVAPIQITSAAFYIDPAFAGRGAILWIFEVRNTTAQTVESARIDFTSRDASGALLTSAFTIMGTIPPGETRAKQGIADHLGTEASGDIKVGEVQYTTEAPNLDAARIASSDWEVDPAFGGDGGAIIWNVEVENTTGVELSSVEVDFSTYDADGKIVGYDATAMGPVPPGARRSSENVAERYGTETAVKFQVARVR